MNRTNLEMLQIIASGLAELKDEVVFVGGAVAELYVQDSGAAPVRPTIDIDLIINIVSKPEFASMEEQLRKLGFTNDFSEGAPICRISNCHDLLEDIRKSDDSVRRYIRETLEEFQAEPNFEEAITYSLSYGEADRLGLIRKKVIEIMDLDDLSDKVSG